jgi:hypothetical protein|tara:strand:+ start:957 stop:1154 length:198 start_codon:yes stop_codon:yes gene_type:complete
MKNRTKLFIILAITGWIRVLIIAVPIAFAWIGINGTNEVIKQTNSEESHVLTGDLHSINTGISNE